MIFEVRVLQELNEHACSFSFGIDFAMVQEFEFANVCNMKRSH